MTSAGRADVEPLPPWSLAHLPRPAAGTARPLAPARDRSAAMLAEQGGRHFLIASVRPDGASLAARLRTAEIELRRLSSVESLGQAGLAFGLRVEDLRVVRVVAPPEQHEEARRWLSRRLLPECAIETVAPGAAAAAFEVGAVFAERGLLPTSQRRAYQREADGRVRVEAFELHVVEHCNLRCQHCCNMSPYLDERVLSAADVEAQCREMARHLRADVFKIMGGEPLLHPDLTGVLEAIRRTGIARVVRLFTNGLLLHRMDDRFWRALDHLTVSSYASAPVPPAQLALVEDKARAFDVVLNVKPVGHFSEVMHATRRDDDAAVQATYDECWLRHRCLVVRDGLFFKCTRAAYLPDFHARVDVTGRDPDPASRRREDGLPVGAPDFGERLAAYLSSPDHLHACRYCLGSSGGLHPHALLGKADVEAGRLVRSRPRAPSP